MYVLEDSTNNTVGSADCNIANAWVWIDIELNTNISNSKWDLLSDEDFDYYFIKANR